MYICRYMPICRTIKQYSTDCVVCEKDTTFSWSKVWNWLQKAYFWISKYPTHCAKYRTYVAVTWHITNILYLFPVCYICTAAETLSIQQNSPTSALNWLKLSTVKWMLTNKKRTQCAINTFVTSTEMPMAKNSRKNLYYKVLHCIRVCTCI